MYILYVDESGDPGVWDDQRCFVLAGVAVHEGQVRRFTEAVTRIQNNYLPDISAPIGLHANELRAGKGPHFRKMDKEVRTRFLHEVYDTITSARFPDLVTFATVMDASVAEDPQQVLRETFEDLCERFNTFLMRQFKHGFKDKGLLVIDQAHEDHYRSLLAGFQKSTTHGYIGNILDIPYFATRRDTRMLQLADFCAYAVFRRYNAGDDSLFKRVLPRYDRRAPNHPPDGLKHITRLPCTCESCGWRHSPR